MRWRGRLRTRRLFPGLFWSVVVLLAAFVIFLQFFITGGTGSMGQEAPASPSPLPTPPPIVYPRPGELTRAVVVSVVDGDTIDVRLPGEGAIVRVRYYGSDAPERGERCYAEATQRNREMVGEAVLLLPDARDKDRFGRLLRYVLREDGTSIDSLLVGEGVAKAWRKDGDLRAELIAREEAAHALRLGCLWGRK